MAVEIARAFHAAVQARKIATMLNLLGPEEVFIAALLGRIGQIAFWCFSGEVGDRLGSAMLDAEREDQAEMKVLGFKLERLTLRLSQEWKLSDLLESALQNKNGTDPRVESLRLGYAIAQASEKGWACPPIKEIMKEARGLLHLSEKDMIKTLHESAMAAVEITESLSMDRVIFALLTPDRRHLKGKYGLGRMDQGYIENFRISASLEVMNIFGYVLRNRKPIWVTEKPDFTIRPLLTEELSNLIGGGPFFAMQVAIKGTAIGVICADRNQSGRRLDEEIFESFAFFGQQANMSLSALGGG